MYMLCEIGPDQITFLREHKFDEQDLDLVAGQIGELNRQIYKVSICAHWFGRAKPAGSWTLPKFKHESMLAGTD